MGKLIFIDDCQLDHFIVKRILSRSRSTYEITCTVDANEVLCYLSQNRSHKDKLPDIILLDIYMPQFDCWDFLDKVQHLYPQLVKSLKIYILSSSINPKDIARSKEYSCVHSFIFKPITNEILKKLMNTPINDVA